MLKRLFTSARSAKPPKTDEQLEIEIGGRARIITFRRSARARRYTLRLKPGTDAFVVTMPAGGTYVFARDFAERHRGWMEKRLAKAAERVPFLPGAVVPVLGVPHRIEHEPALRGSVVPRLGADGQAVLAVSGDLPHVPRRIADYLKKEALRRLNEAVHRHARVLDVSISRITVRDTTSRWGSCSTRGTLSFSWRIVMAPLPVLDYLAAHEVAHRREMNHSVRYWRIVAELDPQFEEAEAWLKRHGASLHHYGPARA